MKLRSHLLLLVLVTALPLLLFMGFLVRRDAGEQREILYRGMRNTARALSLALDGQLKAYRSTLDTLAVSPTLESGNYEAFHVLSVRAAAAHPGSYIVLFDETGQQVINSSKAFGTPLPNPLRQASPSGTDARYPLLPLGGPAIVRQVLETGKPAISDLFVALDWRRPVVTIAVPVVRPDGSRYALELVIPPEPLSGLLLSQGLPSDSTASLLDRRGATVARTRDAAARLGKRLAPSLAAEAASAAEGTGEGYTVEGLAVAHAFARSEYSGWTVSLAVSQDVVGDAVARSVTWLVGGAGLALLLVLGAALGLGRRIVRPITALSRSAGALARGETAHLKASPIDELNDLRDALVNAGSVQRASAAKDEFLAMLSHELRNPLAGLTSAAHVLRVVPPSSEEADKARAVVERQTKNMSRLIDDLLDISRVTLGKLNLRREPLDLAEAAKSVIRGLRESGRLADRSFSFTLEPVWVEGDRARIEQIAMNLLDNALKFTPSDKEIRVEVKREGAAAVLLVADQGAGIEPSEHERIFELFVQGDRAGGGLGIGLALVKKLAALHAGSVTVASEGRGRGSTFTMRLPSVERPSARVGAGPQQSSRERSILIVEDNDDAREMLHSMLALSGHMVKSASDGATGLAMATAGAPELALIDIGLPDMDGHEVARRIRASTPERRIRLIAVSGFGQEEDRQRALDAGFDGHLIKPVTSERLSQVLAELP